MRWGVTVLLVAFVVVPLIAQDQTEGPSSEKAQKTYGKALVHLKHQQFLAAFADFKKADKQDNGLCPGCQKAIIQYGLRLQDWKAAESAAGEMVQEAQDERQIAAAHYQLGVVLYQQAMARHKEELFARSHEEMGKALASYANFPDAVYSDGMALAYLKQDEAAKARFEQFVTMQSAGEVDRKRAQRFASHPELARARMAPAFSLTTMDGQRISLDDLQNKIVLIDFWATWCGPCRAALPQMKELVKKFQGQPMLVLSVSLDKDEKAWREFVAKNEMTWPQYYDGGFEGPISTLFAVHAIPQTFTIGSDGVLQDEHVGDVSIQGKLKKLIANLQQARASDKAGQ